VWLPFEDEGRTVQLVTSTTTPSDAGIADVEESPAASVSVTCFGAFSVVVDGKPIEGWRSGRARALLQYLITHRGRPIASRRLIDDLWPDPDALATGTSLKVAVHALRQTLKLLTADLAILTHAAGYELRAADVWLDVEAFDRLLQRAQQYEATGQASEAVRLYARAVDLHRGDFLADSSDDWVVIRREGLRDEYLHAVARLAEAALAAGDYHACIRRCRQILEQDRCREDVFRLLMVCHARLGQPSRVERWFNLCVQTLRAELDVDPMPETISLRQDVLRRPSRA
jgi:two-component SAPR family response regulator